MSLFYLLILVLLFLMASVLGYVILSSRQVDRNVPIILRDKKKLIDLAANGGPKEFEKDLLSIAKKRTLFLTPAAKRQIINRVRAEFSLYLGKKCVAAWKKQVNNKNYQDDKTFAIFDIMGGYELSEIISETNAYQLLSASQKVWLNELSDNSHLSSNSRDDFYKIIGAASSKINKIGFVNTPVAADIYAIK